jgi:MoaA/NifB/PqqE/SkfB family radical SAM enzyme/SAM-dependent methyltransferase
LLKKQQDIRHAATNAFGIVGVMKNMKGNEFFRILSQTEPFAGMHPSVAAFFLDYLSHEKVVKFDDKYVVNTFFPFFPSPAFNNLIEHFNQIGTIEKRRLYSVTLAVTNRCNYRCWHCYNAGRSQKDISYENLKRTIAELTELSAVSVTLTGGEPLLRADLEDIVRSFDERTYLSLNTTGEGLTFERAQSLKESGLFAIGVSLDSIDPYEHDKMRGKQGAFETVLRALKNVARAGLYPYVITVANHELLQRENFFRFIDFATEAGALEVHLLEPCPTGKLAGNKEVVLSKADKDLILEYHKEIAGRENMPVLSTFLYLESSKAFGCGAGLTHLYIDGSGEVCPCNLVPISFGNVVNESLVQVLDRMSKHFCQPRTVCIGHILAQHIPPGKTPVSLEVAEQVCNEYLPKKHAIPRFFQIRSEAQGSIGIEELKSAYNSIHKYYEEYWVSEAGKPVVELVEKLDFGKVDNVFEAGCGTGYGTCLLGKKLKNQGTITAADISEGMQVEAHNRAVQNALTNINFVLGDALELLKDGRTFDLIFSSWVLGYIPLKDFFQAAGQALNKDGHLAFIAHKENTPYEQLQIYWDIISQDPSVMLKQVKFDFPRDIDYVNSLLTATGLKPKQIWEDKIAFEYDSPEEVTEHLLKSGAGTAFYDAINPVRRELLQQQFINILQEKNAGKSKYKVTHDYIACIAEKR